jgi:alpha-glucosidase (family GH31 glycosyl hydrolase)
MSTQLNRLLGVLVLPVFLLVTQPAVADGVGESVVPRANPVADAAAIVVSGQARFTVLTPGLVRLEWAADRQFEDRASHLVINRRLPVPQYKTSTRNGWLVVQTDALTLEYRKNGGMFNETNLRISFKTGAVGGTWHPGLDDKGNLRGTTRTLDGVEGATALEPGLLSRDGWVLVDDSQRQLYDDSERPWIVMRAAGERQDWYFFAYGHDYKRALLDYTRIAGRIPMPPRFAFGTWWSRYWAYTDEEFKDLVQQFETYDVPLDVLVIDMDWHITSRPEWKDLPLCPGSDTRRCDQAGQTPGWTGFTWNPAYFPAPETFLAWAHDHGLKTTMNLHPASGIQPHEEQYPAMARAMGIDPATKKYVPFDLVDKKFATSFMDIVIHGLERQGVDFWWLDWQQQRTTKIAGVNPTWWLNYVFFTDMQRAGKQRPLIFHRWGGLGNHRYQVGFSGDTISVWSSLAFQPYFTATASNVLFGYWSHDIGGHMPGVVSPELYARWIQYGVFSPILRTHTTKNADSERRIWAYPVDDFRVMRDAFNLRYSLVPYIYTASRQAYETGVSMSRPLYYEHPEAAEAYAFKDEYYFGDDMLVAPVSTPLAADTSLATRRVWLPPGDWIEWFSGAQVKGGAEVERSYMLSEIPVFVKAGAIVPQMPKTRHIGDKPIDSLILTIFPGASSGSTRVYDDAGNSEGYQQGQFSWTAVKHAETAPGTRTIEILPAEGDYPGMPNDRAYEIRLPGTWPADAVALNGHGLPYSATAKAGTWTYDGDTQTTIVTLGRTPIREKGTVTVRTSPGDPRLASGAAGRIARLKQARKILDTNKREEDRSPDVLIRAAQAGNRATVDPSRARDELQALDRMMPDVVAAISALGGDPVIRSRALAQVTIRP